MGTGSGEKTRASSMSTRNGNATPKEDVPTESHPPNARAEAFEQAGSTLLASRGELQLHPHLYVLDVSMDLS